MIDVIVSGGLNLTVEDTGDIINVTVEVAAPMVVEVVVGIPTKEGIVGLAKTDSPEFADVVIPDIAEEASYTASAWAWLTGLLGTVTGSVKAMLVGLVESITSIEERVGALEDKVVAVDSKINDLGSIAGAVTVDLNSGTYLVGSATAPIQLSFTGLPEIGYTKDFTLLLDNIVEITFPINTKFAGGVPPTVISTPYMFVCQINSTGIVTVYSVIDNIKVPV